MPNIFVENISYKTSQADLDSAFATCGNVERVDSATDAETGQPRGFAFVEMTEPQAGQTAISQLNSAELHGRAVNVNEARTKPAGGSHGGGEMTRAVTEGEHRAGKTPDLAREDFLKGAGNAGSRTTDF